MTDSASVEAAIKELRREEGNKRCFLCDERGPTYVDMDHSAFVCTMCAGILREFTFKLKGLSMATFTPSEVRAIKQAGGNVGATNRWLARFKGAKPRSGDKDGIRSFIKEIFITQKYKEKSSSKSKSRSDSSDFESEEEEEEVRKPKSKKTTSKSRKASSDSDASEEEEYEQAARRKSRSRRTSSVEEDTDGKSRPKISISVRSTQTQLRKQQPEQEKSVSSKAPAPSSPNLLDLDFGGFSSVGAQVQASAFPTQQQQVNLDSQNDPFDFGDFESAVPETPAPKQSPSSQQAQHVQQQSLDPFASLSNPSNNSFFTSTATTSPTVPTVNVNPPAPVPQPAVSAAPAAHAFQMPVYQQPPQQQQQWPGVQQQSQGFVPAPPTPPSANVAPQLNPQQEQVLAMMGTMMGNLSRQETIARIQQNPQLMQYFMQMSQAMMQMQMPFATMPVQQQPQPQQQPQAQPQQTAQGTPFAQNYQQPGLMQQQYPLQQQPQKLQQQQEHVQGNGVGYTSNNPEKNPFTQIMLGNKPMATPTEDFFSGFS